MSMITTATSGLMAAQLAMDTISQNIANASTPGYSDQKTLFATRPALLAEGSGGYVGQGVNVSSVTRNYSQFLTNQLNISTSSSSSASEFSTMATQVDSLLSNTTSGVPTQLSAFFNVANAVASNPTSLPLRETLVSQTGSMAKALNQTANQLNGFSTEITGQMQSTVKDINTATTAITELNVQIASATGNGGQVPNDLLDQRDSLVNKVAGYIGVSTITQANGTISMFTGSGQPLVSGITSYAMSTASMGANNSAMKILINGQDITASITGGTLGGDLNFRDNLLNPAQQQLGLAAVGFAQSINNVQTAGFDLNGNPGTAMFNVGTPTVAQTTGTVPFPVASPITVAYDPTNVGSLQASDYKLAYSGGVYTLTQLSNNANIPLPASFPGTPASVGGMIITATAAPQDPSTFLIQPTFNAAYNISSSITDPNLIAAALTSGTPGDNSNALNLAAVENATIFGGGGTQTTSPYAVIGGKQSINAVYQQMVSGVATATQSGQNNSAAQKIALNSATQAQSSLAGVNLNEEASNLLLFQNAYQASAKVVTAAQTVFSALLTAIA
jgi:flagellar hook-associated protein 1 FlgK